jgi:hypothetical protein
VGREWLAEAAWSSRQRTRLSYWWIYDFSDASRRRDRIFAGSRTEQVAPPKHAERGECNDQTDPHHDPCRPGAERF